MCKAAKRNTVRHLFGVGNRPPYTHAVITDLLFVENLNCGLKYADYISPWYEDPVRLKDFVKILTIHEVFCAFEV